MYIDSQAELEAFIGRAMKSDVLAIDTEFLREKSYYPKLCLLQMGTRDERVMVDPFEVKDLTVLRDLLVCNSVVKVFHACHQDLEILLSEIGCIPHPLFDTQVAAALLGHTQQVGYGALVQSLCGVKLKKGDSFTDWSARPLSESQLEYAEDDVIYLPKMYDAQVQKLKEKGRLEWLEAEIAELERPELYQVDEHERFRRLKHVTQLNRRQMAAAREMAAWRELEARKRNVPRKWVLTDEQIVESCRREPRTIDDLFMIRGMRERLTTRDARELMELVVPALDSAPDNWPEIVVSGKSEPNVDIQVDLLTAIVRIRARENDIAVPTLASHSDLVDIARGHRNGVDVLRGWRRKLVGNDLLDLLEGRTVLTIRGRAVFIDRQDRGPDRPDRAD